MRRKIYKSLDKPSSLFGIRGSYLLWVIVGLFAALMLALMVGMITNSLVGFVSFLVGGIVVYLFVIRFQSRFSERERDKWMSSRNLPDVIVFRPVRFKNLSGYKLRVDKRKEGTSQK